MKNLIKDYVLSGKTFNDLKNEFGISSNSFRDLICFNYDQVKSPKTENIVRQSRGIVLDKNTLEIVHYPFFRFFNLDEVYEERLKFNWDNAFGLSKIDGSLIGVFNHNDEWYISTRSQVGGLNITSSNILTFSNIFDMAIPGPRDEFFKELDKRFDYTFELVSPYHRIVTKYDTSTLYIIGVRDKENDFKEINVGEIYNVLPEYIKHPEHYSLKDDEGNFVGFDKMKELADNPENPEDEGFVVVDYSSYNDEFGYFPRIKVKNPAYVELHHLHGNSCKDAILYKNILSVIWKNEQDEVLASFPDLRQVFNEVKNKFDKFMEQFKKEEETLHEFWNMDESERNKPDVKKAFALRVNESDLKSIFFSMFNKHLTLKEFIEKSVDENPDYFKKLWDLTISKF